MSDGPRNKREALDMVSDKVAAWMTATGAEDVFGYTPDFTEAEEKRWDEAWEEVVRRLFVMGTKRTRP